ncbi:hypothetical protein TTHERM_00535850 (macronuclear) [Tetrahymena thermophila SB210]|uniref:Uncharacterized protein n=1 Tax=Tetrahymena thermophila (strain SB210) TaxID=312017 RepID=I7MHT3_TETTS|nr:hypothetical protein TTHERM_00535850 [Tetrahymena thermophila SB210]EAS03249.2 hypothetical protein TTHERM_00535850 [Tetrahymena thermophila SB210]|eukprot:XP_001023494.2 hypothetical protein TTHERM_00535850 [Tetrahymena thermophila SB210]
MKQVVFQAKRVIANKEREKNYQRHISNLHKVYEKDSGIQESINEVQEKLDFQHKNRQNNQKYKYEQERMKIQKENKKLLTALIEISENDKAVKQAEEAASLVLVQPSSKTYQKQMEIYKIQNENFQLAYRMVNLPSVYPKKSFDADYKLHKRRVAQLQKFQPEQSFDPFQSHFSVKSSHRSSSPMSRSYMFMKSACNSNKKIGQTFYTPYSVSANKSFAFSSNNSASPAMRQNESFTFNNQVNKQNQSNFTSSDKYYGEPIKQQQNNPSYGQNNIISNRNKSTQNSSLDNKETNSEVLNKDHKYSSPTKIFANIPLATTPQLPQEQPLAPIQTQTPSRISKQEIKLVMRIFNFQLKIKPRTDDQNDHFYFILKFSANNKKSTPFFKYEMMQSIDFQFNFKLRNNKTPIPKKYPDSQRDQHHIDNQTSRSNSCQHQAKCSLVQNKGNETNVIGHFYLDIDASKKGINEIDVPIYQKDDASTVIGQTKIILHIDIARTLIRKKVLKQHELSETYQVPMEQSPQQSYIQINSYSKINSSHNSSIQNSAQGTCLSGGFQSQKNNNIATNKSYIMSENSTLDAQIKSHSNYNQKDQQFQNSYNDFGYHPNYNNQRQFKSSSVETRSQLKTEHTEGNLSLQRNKISQKSQTNSKVQALNESNQEGIQANNLDTINEYSQKQKRQQNSSHQVFRNTFLDGQISQINKDINFIKSGLQHSTTASNQKESLIKINALKNRLKQIKIELGTLEQQTSSISPKTPKTTQHSQKRTKSSSNKGKVPSLALNLLQKDAQ